MNIQRNIDKLLLALKMQGYEYFVNTSQFTSSKTGRTATKYTIHDGNPREGIDCYSKVKVVENLAFIYKDIMYKRGDSS